MSLESALASLPSFSKTAFSKTNPQIQYKQVRRIRDRSAPKQDEDPPSAALECRATMITQRTFPDAKDIVFINGVDPGCRRKIKFKSTDYPLPFLYGDSTAPSKPQQPSKPIAKHEPSHAERKRPKRDPEPRVEVEVAVQPERKRPKREAERRAEALARQGKQ